MASMIVRPVARRSYASPRAGGPARLLRELPRRGQQPMVMPRESQEDRVLPLHCMLDWELGTLMGV
jgi:hypothetical protein